jgi:hypothetical protein
MSFIYNFIFKIYPNERNKPLARNYPTNPSLGNCLIITPTTNDGEIKAYAFVINDVVNNLWQVPNNDGTPLVPIGTTYGSINDVINTIFMIIICC